MKSRVRTSYRRVERRRKKHAPVLDAPFVSRLSPLARYVEENMGHGVSVSELVWQFQEYDCEHEMVELMTGPGSKKWDHCTACGRMERRK